MTKEDRARIARENGAKSRGPVTDEGKAKSSRNAIKDGQHATKLSLFVPPHGAVTCKEDRQAFYQLMDELLAIYQPVNQLAAGIVKEIATARWQVERLNHCLTAHWNLAFVHSAAAPSAVVAELAELELLVNTSKSLYAGDAVAHRLNRQIDQLELRIARLERRLQFVHAHFPTCVEPPQPVANTEEAPQNEPPVFITENTPAVIAAYKQQFPNREIIVLPPDNVAKGIEEEDQIPIAPRKAA